MHDEQLEKDLAEIDRKAKPLLNLAAKISAISAILLLLAFIFSI